VLSVENWAEARRLHRAEDMPIKTIARVMGISRNTVRAALRSDGPPKYERGLRGHPRSSYRLTRRPAPALHRQRPLMTRSGRPALRGRGCSGPARPAVGANRR
jgi:hypothetical protein